MGLFDLFRKKEGSEKSIAHAKNENPIILAMVMYNQGDAYSHDRLIKELEGNWKLRVKDSNSENNTAVFKINDESIVIMTVDLPIPWTEIEETGKYAYNWEDWRNDLQNHKSHLIISLFPSSRSIMDRNLLFTKFLAAILNTTEALGVYDGTRSLLLPKQLYLNSAHDIKNKSLPYELWVYVGFRESEKGNGIYTYGLKTFGKKEMEISGSDKPLEELYRLMHGLVFFIISRDVTFGDGHTFNLPNGSKANIVESDGKYIDERVLRLVV